MHAYFAIKYYQDLQNKEFIHDICTQLKKAGIDSLCLARDIEKWGEVVLPPDEVMNSAFREIRRADAFIVEMSEKGVGLGIEIGYAKAIGKPVLVLAKETASISQTLEGVATNIVRYKKVSEIAGLVSNHWLE